MAKDQIYSSVIRLNTEDAQNKMEDLRKRVQDLVALRDTIDKKKDSGYYKTVSQQISKAKAELKVYENEVMKTIQTLDNLAGASAKDIRDAQKALQKMIDAKPQGAEEMGDFVRHLQEVKQELQSIATMRAFDEVKAGITGTGKSAHQLGAEMRFLRETSDNIGSASVQQLEKALEVAREHLKVAKQGSNAYERSSEYIRVYSAQLEAIKEKQKQSNTLIDRYNRELKEANMESKSVRNETELINRTLGNISGASVRDLEYSIKALNEQMKDLDRSSEAYLEAEKKLKRLRTEMERTRMESSAQQSAWGKFITFLNTNWGAITQILGAVTGLTMTMRKSVQDYATMEEEMANVRKYTGLATEGVEELNEELKKWDTRTKREDLNKLAGAAGRLGIQTKEGALEFADGANMIKVSLGDDLGEDAVDQIGKLAMAFGEDERKGLRGAMLATGSAVNELSQNSSAKAGFLVDYTARVAGFGKQLGLTQAQIMGYGAVMDENLLRDEMAATAFGNMLTKMQTDTEKFARIAGQSVEDFTKLMNEDANQAILNLADSLRSQDPKTMMKMLDDMGLDGSRAVGVLSTLADKIDDVRERQELATKAYEDATSISKEYEVMNNTVQARLDKCKNKFHEMTIELGAQLLPVVGYTCTGFSMLVKLLSTTTKFVFENKSAILAGGAAIAAYTAYVNAATIATKAHAIATNIAKAATTAFNFVMKMSPIGLLIAALTAAVALFIKYRDRIDGASEATSMLRQAGAKLAGILAQVTGWVINLVRWVVSLYDKFSFLRKIIQLLVTAFTTGFTTITIAVKYLIDELGAVATVIEGIFTLDWDKIKEGYKQGFKAIADAAVAQFNNIKRTVKETFSAPPPAGGGANAVAEGATVGASIGKAAAEKPIEQTLPEIVVKPQKKQSYVSDADTKKQEREQRKAEADRKKKENEERKALREQSKQLKAETEQRLADLTLSYSQGLMDYRSYLSDRKDLQLEGIRERMKLYKEGSAERIALENQEKMMLAHGDEEMQRMSLSLLERVHQLRKAKIEAQYDEEKSDAYHNEWAVNEALFRADIEFLEKKKAFFREGSLERMQIEWDISERSAQHQQELRTRFLVQSERYRQEYFRKSSKEREAEELKAVNDMYDAMKAAGMANERERQDLLTAISVRYARERANKEVEISAEAQKAIDRAQQALGQKKQIGGDTLVSTGFNFATSLTEFINTREQLKTQYDQGIIDYQTYMEAMQSVNGQGWTNIRDAAASALNGVSSILGGVSAYAQACSDLEVARITANYDKQIQAAGNNEKKRKKLEEKRDKEIKKAKNEANKKAMTIQIAQAIASTAANAISAYGAVLIPGVPWTVPLAVAAAAAATASGMLQVATIKKQAQAQEAGYYEGGFTGGRHYRREAGVVHEGEFVANHQAVNNPAIMPFLNFLDQAQRNNTVGSLTAADISRSVNGGTAAVTPSVLAPIVNVDAANDELREAIETHRAATERLLQRLDLPINAQVVLTGPDGLNEQQKRLDNMLKNK